MKIICTTTLLPEVPFVGTQIKVRVPWQPGGNLEYGIFSITMSNAGRIEWGDGTVSEGTRFSKAVHVYPAPGTYRIRVSEGIRNMVLTFNNATDDYSVKYGPAALSFTSNDPELPLVGAYGFAGCCNMTDFDVRGTKISRLLTGEWKGCVSLTGELFFPCVSDITTVDENMPFQGCTGLTKIHLPKAHEAAITSGAAFQADPTLGTGAAECVFDL